MTEIELDVEETYHFIKKGIIVAKKPNGDRLYFKLGEKSIYGIDLIPLTPQEAKELGIEETYTNDKYFDFDIEESESTEEKIDRISEVMKKELDKKTHTVDMSNLSEVEKAKQVLAEREKVLASQQNVKTREEIESENEDLRAKLEIVAEKSLEKRMDALDLSEEQKNRIRTAEHPIEVLKGVETAMQKESTGYAPLEGQNPKKYFGSYDSNPFGKTYPDMKSMIDDLRLMEKSKDKEVSAKAKLVLNELFKRHRTIGKDKGFSSEHEGYQQPSIEELTKKEKKHGEK